MVKISTIAVMMAPTSLEHGHIPEVKLRRQLFRVAKAGAFQHEAKTKADHGKNRVHERLANECFER